jgi:hypothetical protein
MLAQPEGSIEADAAGVRNRDRDRAGTVFLRFLEKAVETGADLAVTPEYSLPWETLSASLRKGVRPAVGKLWALGCESLTLAQLIARKTELADIATVIFEPMVERANRFLDPLVYMFLAEPDVGGPFKLVLLVQFKTHPMGAAVAKIESDLNPRERTGSYIGLFQLSKSEFNKYGSGDILNPRDNAMAAAYKFITEAALFEATTHMELTFANLYLIHQQGWEGAAEHLRHPQQIAWKSMCATHEGMTKGEGWCKRAIWGNTLPEVKREWTSVDRLTSAAFVAMWRDRVDTLYARYPAANVNAAAAGSLRSNSL